MDWLVIHISYQCRRCGRIASNRASCHNKKNAVPCISFEDAGYLMDVNEHALNTLSPIATKPSGNAPSFKSSHV